MALYSSAGVFSSLCSIRGISSWEFLSSSRPMPSGIFSNSFSRPGQGPRVRDSARSLFPRNQAPILASDCCDLSSEMCHHSDGVAGSGSVAMTAAEISPWRITGRSLGRYLPRYLAHGGDANKLAEEPGQLFRVTPRDGSPSWNFLCFSSLQQDLETLGQLLY